MTRNRRNIVLGVGGDRHAWHAGHVVRGGAAVSAVLRGHRLWRHAESIGLAAAPGRLRQTIKVRFNADTNPALPWKFAPDQPEVSLNLGEEKIAFYHATNQAQRP